LIIDQICLPSAQRQESVVSDKSGNVIETHEHAGDFKEWWVHFCPENAARRLNWSSSFIQGGPCPRNTVPGEVALVSWARRLRSRKRPALERESKVQKKE